MPRFPRSVDPARLGAAHTRLGAAHARLGAARRRFDLSTIALRKAALDHVDGQILVSVALRETLARLSPPPGPAL